MTDTPATALSPAVAKALALWQERMDAMRDGVTLPADAYALELEALVACSDAEWEQVAEAKRESARRMLAELHREPIPALPPTEDDDE